MLKLLLKVFTKKPPRIDHAEMTGMQRMSRMRRRTDEMAKLNEVLTNEEEEFDEKRDILTKARDLEI